MQATEICQARLSQGKASSAAKMQVDGAPPVSCLEVQEVISAMNQLTKLKEEGNK